MLTTVQDLGRWGFQAAGVPVAGPMDAYSHRLANRLVGNGDADAALEVTLIGPEFEASASLVCAVSGAEFRVTIDDAPVPLHTPFEIAAGARLRFGTRGAGARAAIAIRGGIAVEPVFGSRATSVVARLGPFGGRALKTGDTLPIGPDPSPARLRAGEPLPIPFGGARVRVMSGPHDSMFAPSAYGVLYGSRFIITPNSNRMGYRLEGPRLEHAGTADILSDGTPIGSIQVPASGQPIVLMADRQTTGGYPKIATVITADLPILGQLAPGDWVEFAPCSRPQAVAALREQERLLEGPE
jgi:biotin-dependent carboxylase-like uncharacterized protein